MEQTLSELHPNPGWGAPEIHATDMVGKHCILELYDCDPSRLDDEAFIRTTITSAAKGAGATLLNLITHQFQPQGVTGPGPAGGIPHFHPHLAGIRLRRG